MPDPKKSLDDAASAAFDVLSKVAVGSPEGATAKVLVSVLAYAAGTPWLLAAEPLVQRLFERINNKAGKDAVADIAAEVKSEEGLRKVLNEVPVAQVRQVLDALFKQQAARGGIGLGDIIEVIEGSMADAVARVGLLLHRVEERLANPPGVADPRAPLIHRLVLTGPTTTMRASSRSDERVFEVRAARFDAQPRLTLEVTNLSRHDVRVLGVNVDVIECVEVEIETIWSWYGLMRPVRKYRVDLKALPGRYRCVAEQSSEDEYLVLPYGDLEVFSVTVTLPPSEVVYRLGMSTECACGGEVFVQALHRIVQFGSYDPTKRQVTRDHPRHGDGPPSDDGADTCLADETRRLVARATRSQ